MIQKEVTFNPKCQHAQTIHNATYTNRIFDREEAYAYLHNIAKTLKKYKLVKKYNQLLPYFTTKKMQLQPFHTSTKDSMKITTSKTLLS